MSDPQVVISPVSPIIEIVVSLSPPRGAAGRNGTDGASAAAQVSYDDTLTNLGVNNVQDAIVALYLLIKGATPSEDGQLDFSNPDQSGLQPGL